MTTESRRVVASLLVAWPVLTLLVHGARIGHWLDQGALPVPIGVRLLLWAGTGAVLSGVVWFVWNRWLAPSGTAVGRLVTLGLLCVFAGLVFAGVTDQIEWPGMRFRRRRAPFWTRAMLPTLAMFAWAAVQYTLDTHRRFAEEHQRLLKAEALAAEARLAVLRYELNPHFLFNALNSVIGVIDENPRHAQKMIRQLSGLLRHTLDSPAVSTLGKEVEVASKYLAIEKVRFEERLEVVIEVPDALHSVPVPPMVLQPLVENAVKHGRRTDVLTVAVRARLEGSELVLSVRNPGALVPVRDGAVGLRNLRERLESAGRGTCTLDAVDDDVVATLRLPIGGGA